jgi:hypothetical protein
LISSLIFFVGALSDSISGKEWHLRTWIHHWFKTI